MASIIAWLIGFLLLGVGCYILLLRFEGLVDRIKPHNLTIGQMTVDGEDSKSYAELLRARFNHHFRQPDAIPKQTGFLEVMILDTPELFQPKNVDSELKSMTFDVSGVNVSKLLQIFNQVAKPDQWLVEGDFQAQSDRALLALRLRRGERLIRTWYLERFGQTATDKSMLLEQLIDDAIFQLVYDFGNASEADADLYKWRRLIHMPTQFPSRTAVAAYFEARGALGRYYAHGEWKDLDLALKRLQTLRSQMPEFAAGLQLLGMALAEKRKEAEAVHVYEQLHLLLFPAGKAWSDLDASEKRRLLTIELLKATATAKRYTWQTTHDAVRQLSLLAGKLHAFLARRYVKGRDVYDLAWYLSDRTWPEPNLDLLNNALAQTRRHGPQVMAENWRQLVADRVETLDWRQVAADVEPFLERPADIALLTRENLSSLLRRQG